MKSESVELPKSQTHWRHSGFESDFRTVCPIEWIWRRAFIFRRFLVVLIFIVLTQQKFIDWHVKCFYERIENGLTNVESHFNIAELHTSTNTHTHAFQSLFWSILRLLWIALCLNLRHLSTWSNIHFRALDFCKKMWDTLAASIKISNQFIVKIYHENCLDNRISYGLYAKMDSTKVLQIMSWRPRDFKMPIPRDWISLI